jgi:TolB-like protein/Flp pilus assembly protein TadD
MLAGEPPFTASSAAALVAKRFTSAVPSVRGKRPEVPAAVDDALQRALALRPDDRFPSMHDFSRAATSLVALSSAEIRALSASDARTPTPGMGVPATQVTPVAAPPRRRAPLLVGVAVLAALGIGGILLARRGGTRAAAPETTTGAMRLAVLPFENLGDTADAYFADGISDELRGKLTALPGLEVIARSSSVPYRGTAKPPQVIAKELGVRYLLTGTVRWEKSGGGKGRVRVSPELIEVSPNGAPASKWQQPFDAPITDVFQVQGDIAGKVASALDVALGSGQQQVLSARPTENLQAYDAYLRGEAAWGGNSSSGSEAIRSAIDHYEHATALDSGFALAWAQLARASSAAYYNLTPLQRFADRARVASERAVALAPDRPESQLALGDYFSFIHEDDTRALEAYRRGLQMAPSDAELLSSAAISEWGLGRFQDAEQHLTKSQTLDPRSVNTLRRLATLELRLRNYTAAQGTVDRGLALAPTSLTLIELGTMNHLAQGDLPGAHQVVREGLKRVEPASLVAYLSNFFDLYWVLEEPEQRLALQGTPAQYGDDRGTWALVLTQLNHLRGDEARARVYADSARIAITAQLKDTPDNSARQMALALSLAYLGRFQEAIDQGERALARTPPSKDALAGPYYQHQLSRIYLMAGQPNKALDLLEPLLRMPYYLSPGWLKVDPAFVPLRGTPRFEKLTGGS